jgi:hypothetical protein
MEAKEIKETILDAMIVGLEAQAGALRRLRRAPEGVKPRRRIGMSQVDFVQDILARAGKPLHIDQIIAQVKQVHGQSIERESIVSALSKKVARADRFVRVDKNTFALKGGRG